MRARYIAWIALTTAAACSDEPNIAPLLHPERGRDAADAMVADQDAQSPAPSDDVCATGIARAGYTEYRLELAALCAVLAREGRVRCPDSRRDLIETSVDCSPEHTSFPTLRHHCGTDMFYQSFSEPLLNITWTFHSDGSLIAATVAGSGPAFPCGRGTYLAGPPFTTCDTADKECRLCESGPERDAECPDDVVEALPGKACTTPAVAPGCACESAGPSFASLPREGAACGAPDTCPRCQSGTCWATCECALDGVRRWNVDCTE